MNTIKPEISHKLTYDYIFKTIFFYVFFFLLLYGEPISIGGMTIGILWKIVFLALMVLPVSNYISERKSIEPFILFAILLSIKMLFNMSSIEYFSSNISIVAKNLMFPILFLFFMIKLNPTQLINLARHISILVVLSFVPFMLGILSPLSEGYDLEAFGLGEGAFGLVGIFGGAHGASEVLGITLIVLFYFFQNAKNKNIKLMYLGLLGLGVYELLLTYARAGLLIAFVGLFYLWIKEKGQKKLITAIMIIVPISFMSIYMYITNPVIQMRMNDETVYSKKSGQVREIGSGRPTIAKNVLNNWYKEGLAGQTIGLGFQYGLFLMRENYGLNMFAHNNFIQMLQQEGLIGLMLFLLYLFYLFKYIRKRKTNQYYNISMALFLGYMAEMAVQGNFVFIMLLFLAIFLVLIKKTGKLISD